MTTGDPGVIAAHWDGMVLFGGLVAAGLVAVGAVVAVSAVGTAGGAVGAAGGTVAASTVDNEPPQADAGLDRDVVVNETVFLDAAGSFDPDGEIADYDWRIERPDGSYTRPDCATCERTGFVPRQAGRYNVTVTVRDDDGAERSDTLWVDVAVSTGPVVSLSGADRVTEGLSVDLAASASAGDADLVRVRWYQDGSYQASSALAGGAATPVLDRTFDEPGSTTIRAEILDRAGRTTSASHTVDVLPSNLPPSAIAPASRDVGQGESVTVTGEATDPDDEASDLAYSWSSDDVEVVAASGREATLRAPSPVEGDRYPIDARVTFTVSDGELEDSDSFTVTVHRDVTADIDAPDVIRAGEQVELRAVGNGTGDLAYSWGFSNPDRGFDEVQQFGNSETVSFTGPDVPAQVSFNFTLEVASPTDRAVASHTIEVLPATGSSPSSGVGTGPGGSGSDGDSPVTYKDLGEEQSDHYDNGWCTTAWANDDCDDDYRVDVVDGQAYAILVDQDGDHELRYEGVHDGTHELLIGEIPADSRIAQIAVPMGKFWSLEQSAFDARYGDGSFEPIRQNEQNQEPSSDAFN